MRVRTERIGRLVGEALARQSLEEDWNTRLTHGGKRSFFASREGNMRGLAAAKPLAGY
jgi:hypothetical protein